MVSKANESGERLMNIRLPKETVARLDKCLPWGIRSEMYRRITDELLTILETESCDMFLGALLKGRITFTLKKEHTEDEHKQL